MSIVKPNGCNFMSRMFSVLQPFHLHMHAYNIPNKGIVLCQGSFKSCVWTMVWFKTTTNKDDEISSQITCETNKYGLLHSTFMVSQVAAALSTNYRRSADVTINFFEPDDEHPGDFKVVLRSKPTDRNYGMIMETTNCESYTVGDTNMLEHLSDLPNDPTGEIYMDFLSYTPIGQNAPITIYMTYCECWVTALKIHKKTNTTHIVLGRSFTSNGAFKYFTLQALHDGELNAPKTSILIVPGTTQQSITSKSNRSKKIKLATEDLYNAVFKQGATNRHDKQMIVYWSESDNYQVDLQHAHLFPGDIVFRTDYDTHTRLYVVMQSLFKK